MTQSSENGSPKRDVRSWKRDRSNQHSDYFLIINQ